MSKFEIFNMRFSQIRRLLNRNKVEVVYFLFGMIRLKKRRFFRIIKNILGDKEDLNKVNKKYPKKIKKQANFINKSEKISGFGELIFSEGMVPIFGKKINIGWPPKFETEETGKWSKGKSNKIRYYGEGIEDDIKIIWELHRLQWLPNIAYFAAKNDNQQLANEIIRTLIKYGEEHRVYNTISWMEGIEVALRSISIIDTLNYISDIIEEGHNIRKIHTILVMHAKWIEDNLSYKWKLNNNHLLTELVGLTILGLYLDWHPSSKRWVRKGISGLKKELEVQIVNGRNWEPTTAYHRFVTEGLLVLVNHLNSSNLIEERDIFRKIVEEMLETLCWMTTKSGKMPLVGDDDGGYVITRGDWEINDNTDVIEYANALGLKFKKNPEGIRIWDSLGFAVIRSGNTVIHCVSGASKGTKRQGSHRHLDMLSIAIVSGNKNIINDAGTGVYFGSKEWRKYFREARNHSGIRSGIEAWAKINDLFEIRNPPLGKIEQEKDAVILTCIDSNKKSQKRIISMSEQNIKIIDILSIPNPIVTFILEDGVRGINEEGELIISGDNFSIKQKPRAKNIFERNEFTNPEESSPHEKTSTISYGYGEYMSSKIFEIEHNKDTKIITEISLN